MALDLHVFRTLGDNAGALLHDPASGTCAAIDVPDAGQVMAAAKAKGWTISDVFVTHAHADHARSGHGHVLASAVRLAAGCG